jgi:hypothetical protein
MARERWRPVRCAAVEQRRVQPAKHACIPNSRRWRYYRDGLGHYRGRSRGYPSSLASTRRLHSSLCIGNLVQGRRGPNGRTSWSRHGPTVWAVKGYLPPGASESTRATYRLPEAVPRQSRSNRPRNFTADIIDIGACLLIRQPTRVPTTYGVG